MLSYGGKIVTDGLIQCWDASLAKSYTGVGDVWRDVVSSGANGVSITAADYVSGKGVNITGTNCFFTLPLLFRENQTIEMWYLPRSTGSTGGGQFESPPTFKIGNYASPSSLVVWNWHFTNSQQGIRVFVANPNVWTNLVEPNYYWTNAQWAAKWHHIVFAVTGFAGKWSGANLYVDKVLYNNINFSQGFPSGSLTINGGDKMYFDYSNGGAMNNDYGCIRVYNRTLSPAEIEQNYNVGKGKYS